MFSIVSCQRVVCGFSEGRDAHKTQSKILQNTEALIQTSNMKSVGSK